MEKPRVDENKCLGCSGCVAVCPEDAIDFTDRAKIIEDKCISCYICVNYCPIGAINGGDRK